MDMASSVSESSSRITTGGELNGTISSGTTEEESYELHQAAFHGDVPQVREILEKKLVEPNARDKHGNTALHIAVMLGHRGVTEALLEHKALVKEKNQLGWTPLDEALSYGNRDTVLLLLRKLRDQTTDALIDRRRELIGSLENLDDFYAELKWEFHTWVPFLSRLLPSDIVRVYKSGARIRLNSTLGDFTEMKWSRGDLSFIFDGESTLLSNTFSMVVLDNNAKEYQRIKLLGSEDLQSDLKDHVNMLLTRPITYANMSTQPIVISRAQTGWFFKQDKSEIVGEYDTDVYNINNLILISRKRREHLTPEQIQKHEQIQKKVESGKLDEADLVSEAGEETSVDEEVMESIDPPPLNDISWEDYISAPVGSAPHLGRKMDLKIDRKHYKASVCVTEKCPIELKRLLDILEVVAPYKHFNKLRQFVDLKLPAGFPVKLDIPVFPAVTAVVTLEKYELCDTPPGTFLIPRGYKKYIQKTESANNEQDSQSSPPPPPPTGEGTTNANATS